MKVGPITETLATGRLGTTHAPVYLVPACTRQLEHGAEDEEAQDKYKKDGSVEQIAPSPLALRETGQLFHGLREQTAGPVKIHSLHSAQNAPP